MAKITSVIAGERETTLNPCLGTDLSQNKKERINIGMVNLHFIIGIIFNPIEKSIIYQT